jgi:hypothetical protein
MSLYVKKFFKLKSKKYSCPIKKDCDPTKKKKDLAELDPSAKHDYKRLTVTLNEYETRCLELYARKTGLKQAQLFRLAMVSAATKAIGED